MKNLIKLDTQNGYNLWRLEIGNITVYNISLISEPPPDSGYFDPKYIEDHYDVLFPPWIYKPNED